MGNQFNADYEVILAAIGRHIDGQRWKRVCIMELEGGILIQGNAIVPTSEAYAYVTHTEVLDQEALRKLMAPFAKP